MATFLKKVGLFILETIQTIVLALSVFIIFYLFIFQPHQVKGSSMQPNFENRELLLTNKFVYRFGAPQRGDVVVFKAPSSEPCAEIECEYIKRIIGLPGETIKLAKNKVYVDGKILNQSAFLANGTSTSPGAYLIEGVERIIPTDYYLVMGDNRPKSRDSREFGPISRSAIIGKAWVRYWPLKSFRVVKHLDF